MNYNEWNQSKLRVDQLDSNYGEVLRSYRKKYPQMVNTTSVGKNERMEVRLSDVMYNLFLIVYQSANGEVKQANYILFDDQKSLCYKRSL